MKFYRVVLLKLRKVSVAVTETQTCGGFNTAVSLALMAECSFREAAYDWGPCRKTHELVAGFVIGLMMAFNIRFLEHSLYLSPELLRSDIHPFFSPQPYSVFSVVTFPSHLCFQLQSRPLRRSTNTGDRA